MNKLLTLIMILTFSFASCQNKESELILPINTEYNDTVYVQLPPIIVHDTIVETVTVTKWKDPVVTEIDSLTSTRFLAHGKDTLGVWNYYVVGKYGRPLRIETQDTLGMHVNKIKAGSRIAMKLKYTRHEYNDSVYTFQKVQLLELPFRRLAYKIRSMDSVSAKVQTYFNKDWEFSWKEENTPQLLAEAEWTPWGYQAGHPHPYSWRHTHSFTTKYWQIRARDKETGEIVILPVTGNIYKP